MPSPNQRPSDDALKLLLKQAQRVLAKTDPVHYIEYVFEVKLAAHHRRMIEFALDIIDNKKSGIILAPRGSGKTTVLNTGLQSWLVAVRPDIRIAMLSQKAEKAEAMSGAIQNVISETPESLEVFGNLRGRFKWTASEWLRKDSPHYKTKDRTMVAAGADQSSGVVSKRFDLILADDILDENNTYTIDRREKIETWFWKTLKPTQAAEGCATLVIGCLDRATPVLMADGTWRAIDAVHEGEMVWSVDETGAAGPRLVEASLDQGESEVLSVKTAKTEILATPWHPFLTARNGGLEWVRADHLTVDDFIVETKEIPGVNEHAWMDEEFCWLLGFLFGDGWVGSGRQYIACAMGSDEEMNQRVLAALDRWFPMTPFYRTPFGYVRCDSPVVARALADLGLDGKAKTKRVPAWVFRATPEYRRSFLRGVCDADGHYPKKSTDTARVELANGPLVKDLWQLALTCGVRPTAITHRMRVSQPPHSPEPIEAHSWATNLNFATVGTMEYAPKGVIAKNVNATRYHARESARLLGSESRVVPVVSVEPAGVRHVWDLTVEGTHAFIADGLAVHNTRWVEGDLYQKIIDDNKWPSLVIPALTTDEDEVDHSYWPAVWPLERLYAEREDVGWDNFACSYLNDIQSRGGMIFQRDWWKDQYFEDLPSDRQYVYTMGVDLASSEKQRADFTSLAIVAQDDRHEHWVLHTERTKTDSGHRAFVESGYNWAKTNGITISRIVVETNQHQSTFVQDLIRQTSLPVVGKRTDTDKRTRARAAAARYESHRVHHHISLKGRELESEMLGFPKGHDDLVDALGLAMDLGGVSGSIATVSGSPRASSSVSDRIPKEGREVTFQDGPQLLPAYLADMLAGIETEAMSYEQAVSMANQKRLNDYVRMAMSGAIPRNG